MHSEINHLLTLRNLTHLAGILVIKALDIALNREGLRIIKRLSTLPKLTFIEVVLNDVTTWIKLKRRGGKFNGYHVVPHPRGIDKSRFDIDKTNWGHYYTGLV